MGRGEGTSGALRVGVVVSVLLVARPAAAQNVAFDSATSAGGSTVGLLFTHTVAPGNDRFLVVAVAIQPAGTAVAIVSFAGRPLSRIGARSSSSCRTELWGLVAPPAGAQSVEIGLDNPPTAWVAGVSSYTGVNQKDPVGNYASHTGTGGAPQSLSVSVANDASDYTVDVLCGASSGGAPTPKAGADQTQRWRRAQATVTGVGSTQRNASAGRATMSWTLDGSGTIDWSISTTPLHAAPPPPPPDAGPDAAPDLAPDLAQDLAPDLAPDLAEDVASPADAGADAEADAVQADLAAEDLRPDDNLQVDAPVIPRTVEYRLRVGCACRTGGPSGGGGLLLLLVVVGCARRGTRPGKAPSPPLSGARTRTPARTLSP